MNYFRASTDASDEFGYAAALMAVSGMCLGRRWIDRGRMIKPNMFMLLVGDSSVARKSTSVVMTREILEQVEPERMGPRDFTTEGLTRWMMGKDSLGQQRNRVMICADEFGADLARAQAYGGTFQTDLCSLYDGESFEKIRAKGEPIAIEKPRVSLFGAAAYSMMSRYLKPVDWHTGFLLRFMFVAPKTKRQGFAVQPVVSAGLRTAAYDAARLLNDTLQTGSLSLSISTTAEAMYANFCMIARARIKPDVEVERVYVERFTTSVMKLALFFQTDIDPTARVIGDHAMHEACDFAHNSCWDTFTDAHMRTGMDDVQHLVGVIVDQIKANNGEIARKDLARLTFGNQRFNEAVDYLLRNGFLRSVKKIENNSNFDLLQLA